MMSEVGSNKTVIVVAGPTAVGKTSVAIELARHFGTEIVSADSRQCYRELNIGVARPSVDELNSVPHHFIASHSIDPENNEESIDAAYFERYALQKTEELFKVHHQVVLVGGTGLYIKAFCESMDEIPSVDKEIRTSIISNFELNGLEWLQGEVRKRDPDFYAVGEIQNPQRLMRALEIKEATGKSILEFRSGQRAKRDFNIIKIGLELPKEELHQRINHRVDLMMENGLLDEVKQVQHFRNTNALQTVGYKELFAYLDGMIELEVAVEQIKGNTRKYAKRQMTWFKKDAAFAWFAPFEMDKIKNHLEYRLNNP